MNNTTPYAIAKAKYKDGTEVMFIEQELSDDFVKALKKHNKDDADEVSLTWVDSNGVETTQKFEKGGN